MVVETSTFTLIKNQPCALDAGWGRGFDMSEIKTMKPTMALKLVRTKASHNYPTLTTCTDFWTHHYKFQQAWEAIEDGTIEWRDIEIGEE